MSIAPLPSASPLFMKKYVVPTQGFPKSLCGSSTVLQSSRTPSGRALKPGNPLTSGFSNVEGAIERTNRRVQSPSRDQVLPSPRPLGSIVLPEIPVPFRPRHCLVDSNQRSHREDHRGKGSKPPPSRSAVSPRNPRSADTGRALREYFLILPSRSFLIQVRRDALRIPANALVGLLHFRIDCTSPAAKCRSHRNCSCHLQSGSCPETSNPTCGSACTHWPRCALCALPQPSHRPQSRPVHTSRLSRPYLLGFR